MDTETALLTAVRNRLRTALQYTETQCDVEFDEVPPVTVGDFYVAVIPGGWRPGPRNNHSGGILDEVLDIEVVVIQRAPKRPKDRSRELFLDTLQGINKRHREILAAVGQFDYTALNAASAMLTGGQGFVEALKFGGLEPKPRAVGGEYFGAGGNETFAGLVRIAKYVGARRIQAISGGIT